jgi:hypothetical protein
MSHRYSVQPIPLEFRVNLQSFSLYAANPVFGVEYVTQVQSSTLISTQVSVEQGVNLNSITLYAANPAFEVEYITQVQCPTPPSSVQS